ncbi:hypothetical protein J9303_05375 [Bacillaceae bacterium Marseille-Q3522]|nr:hypothetical protein [Bacillaceae bacterium Marseille-Q3522]
MDRRRSLPSIQMVKQPYGLAPGAGQKEKRRALGQTDRLLEAFGPKAQFAFDPNGETAVRFSARSWTKRKA